MILWFIIIIIILFIISYLYFFKKEYFENEECQSLENRYNEKRTKDDLWESCILKGIGMEKSCSWPWSIPPFMDPCIILRNKSKVK